MDEFSLIADFFKSKAIQAPNVVVGIGDDAACLQVPSGMDLLVTTDTLVSNVHFLPQWNPYDIACKAVMVNVSDIAAMGGIPCWASLALTLPHIDTTWLSAFSSGIQKSLEKFNIALIGGDTTKGPLSITITMHGFVPSGKAVKRSGAKAGDLIFVTGELGAAALAVKGLTTHTIEPLHQEFLMQQLNHPVPRVDLSSLLRKYATSAIDVSDGLTQDLNHICMSSQVGASLIKEAIPIHPLVSQYLKQDALAFSMQGGEDYVLCFTVSKAQVDSFLNEMTKVNMICYCIGSIEKEPGLRFKIREGEFEPCYYSGYKHF